MSNLTDFFPSSGGGGGTPIGGYTFFETPPNYTGFVSGQEVWTDESSQVWLKTEAILTSAGTGVLDASIYTNSVPALIPSSTSFNQTMGGSGRLQFSYNGKHIIGLGQGVNNYGYVRYFMRDADGGSVAGAQAYNTTPWSSVDNNPGADKWAFGSSFGNDTHAFTTFYRVNYDANGEGAQQAANFAWSARYAYTPYTTYTNNSAAGYATSNQSPYWIRNQRVQMCVTHIETTPRYWQMGYGSTSATEVSFNASASNGTDPFTAVSPSNVVNFGTAVNVFKSNGVDKFYGHTGTVLNEYSLNGTLLTSFAGVPSEGGSTQYGSSNYGVAVIPSFETTSGNTEFWFPVITSTGSTPNTTFTKYELVDTIKGPVYTSGTATVSMVGVGDVAITDNLNSISMWKRIA